MSFCTQDILTLASGLYADVLSPTAISVGYISGVLTSPAFLGDLNLKLTTCFYVSGDAPCIMGGFGKEEASIYGLMWQGGYYKREALNALQGVGWTSMAEGDTRISREGSSLRSKAFMELYKQTDTDLRIAVANWKVAHTIPGQVVAAPLASWPSP